MPSLLTQYKDFLITLFHLWYEDWKKGCQPYIRQFENYICILMATARKPVISAVYAISRMQWKQTAAFIPVISMYWMNTGWEILIRTSWIALTGASGNRIY